MFSKIQERQFFIAFSAFEHCSGIPLLYAIMVARDMFIETAGIEDVVAMWTPCVAMVYYHVLIQALVRNRFATFEALHAEKERQIWHQFPYIGTDIKQISWGGEM
jgi:hypothetical protein